MRQRLDDDHDLCNAVDAYGQHRQFQPLAEVVEAEGESVLS
jgi:hypothetical protein